MSILLQKLSHKKHIVFLIYASIILGSVVVGQHITPANAFIPGEFSGGSNCWQTESNCRWEKRGNTCARICNAKEQCFGSEYTLENPPESTNREYDPIIIDEKCGPSCGPYTNRFDGSSITCPDEPSICQGDINTNLPHPSIQCKSQCTYSVRNPICPTNCGAAASRPHEICTDNTGGAGCLDGSTCEDYTRKQVSCPAVPNCEWVEGNCPDWTNSCRDLMRVRNNPTCKEYTTTHSFNGGSTKVYGDTLADSSQCGSKPRFSLCTRDCSEIDGCETVNGSCIPECNADENETRCGNTCCNTDTHECNNNRCVPKTVTPPPPASWSIEEWSECSCNSGIGTQTRLEATCQRGDEVADESDCSEPKPSTTNDCSDECSVTPPQTCGPNNPNGTCSTGECCGGSCFDDTEWHDSGECIDTSDDCSEGKIFQLRKACIDDAVYDIPYNHPQRFSQFPMGQYLRSVNCTPTCSTEEPIEEPTEEEEGGDDPDEPDEPDEPEPTGPQDGDSCEYEGSLNVGCTCTSAEWQGGECVCTATECGRYISREVYDKTKGVSVTPVAGSIDKLKVQWGRQFYLPQRCSYHPPAKKVYSVNTLYYCQGTASQCIQPSKKNNSLNSRWRKWTGSINNISDTRASTTITGLRAGMQYYVTVTSDKNHYTDTCYYRDCHNRSLAGVTCYEYNRYGEYSTKKSASTNKRCPAAQLCGRGTRAVGGIVPASAQCSTCPTPPTVQNPVYWVNDSTCAVNADIKYSAGTPPVTYARSVTAGSGTHNWSEQHLTGGTGGLTLYTFKTGDYGQPYTFSIHAGKGNLWSHPTTRRFTAPRQHPGNKFTITQTQGNRVQLNYDPQNVRATLAGLRFKWEFSEQPTFHNRTNENSINPLVSFATTGFKTIKLTVTDTAIPGTRGGCSSTQIFGAGASSTSSSKMVAPTIDSVEYLLADAPMCAPYAKITYTSTEEQRKDVIKILTGNTQVHTAQQNVSQPSTRSFTVPINKGTEYRAVLTTHDFSSGQTKAASDPVEYRFVVPNIEKIPTADFSYAITANGTVQLDYTGNANSIRWNFSENPSYIQGSATSKSIAVAFPTNGTKTISLTASTSESVFNECTHSQSIDVQPAPGEPGFPIIREIPPNF